MCRLGFMASTSSDPIMQIMNLLSLAPDIQEAILMLPPLGAQKDPVIELQLRPLCARWIGRGSASCGNPNPNPPIAPVDTVRSECSPDFACLSRN